MASFNPVSLLLAIGRDFYCPAHFQTESSFLVNMEIKQLQLVDEGDGHEEPGFHM
jgi:hypothetical protein